MRVTLTTSHPFDSAHSYSQIVRYQVLKILNFYISSQFLLERDAKQLKHKAILWLENDPLLLGGSKRNVQRDEE